MLENDISKYMDANLQIHKNCAMTVLQNGNFKDTFPNAKNISDIVLQMCYLIRKNFATDGQDNIFDGKIDIPMEIFQNIITKCRELYLEGWSKYFRELSINKLTDEIIYEMKDRQMIEVANNCERVLILPLAGKITGKYPKDYVRGEDNVKMEDE